MTRVVLDGTPLLGARTGVGRYTSHLLAALSAGPPGLDLAATAFTWRGLADLADAVPLGMVSTAMDSELADTVLRLLRALERPLEAHALGPSLLREIYYRVLVGEQGPALRAALASRDRFGQIARAIRRIQTAFHEHITVTDLAREANMSLPSFHNHFKVVTHTTPAQYLKSTRLHQARLLMIRSGLSALDASARVGYESPSQFSREFKRLFGRPPLEETRRMRNMLRVKAESAWPDFQVDYE